MSETDEPSDNQSDIEAVGRIAAIPTILDVVCRITGMGFAAVARVTETKWLACSVLDMIDFGLKPGGELKLETTICHEIRQHREAVIIDNVSESPLYKNHHTPAMYGLQSYISMPIILPDGTFFGTLCAIDPKPRLLNRVEIVGTFKLFAELIAFHLDSNIKLAKSEESLKEEREVSELREQFIAVLGHDLRNPLASISAGVTMLRRRPERAAELSVHIEQSILRMSGLIDNVLDFARGRLGGGLPISDTASVYLEPALTQIVRELQGTHPNQTIETDFDLETPVVCDTGRIGQVLSNLLGNAITHGDKALPVRVRGFVKGGVFELSVTNSGEPIPPQAMEKLFQPFFRGAVRPSQEGLGLGLFIASEIAKAHGGSIEVSSSEAETSFTLRMPAGG